ncbi:peptidase S8/S53 domain-containing protein [Mycena belliarum]|uniref:Peptidase S8/S53 domain-containing protein n=1 Tax=Mycena belliarum TaxID=1033014 RepID=A0AAD6XHW5_9AGAR|nr:peptidase S8/S53 domain-containing protein [Mycena belliae]
MSSPIADLEPASPLPPPPKRYIIRLKPQVDRDAHLQGHLEKFSSHDFELHHTLDHRNVYAATISAAVLAREFQLGPDSPIEAIREDHEMRISDVSWSRKVKSWGLARINRDAKLTGSGEWNYHYDNTLETGKGINVYIIDTGIYSAHSDFQGRVQSAWVYADYKAGDSNGHGTHVAGTIGGSTHGVAPAATLHDVKALNDSGTGWSSVITKAMEWVLDNATLPAVVNMSFEGSDDEDQKEYVEELTEKGIHVVVVAGNAGTDAKATSPANAPTAVTVGATNEDDEKWTSSNTGTCLDLLAPGVDIPSCGTANVNAFVEKSGTSMAAPHVSGIIASILSLSEANQKWSPKEMKGVLVALSVKDALTKLGT